MPIFITQGRFTQAYVKGMLAKPEDRSEAIKQLAAKAGGKLVAFYMTFGEYDFMMISEGTTESAAAALIAAAASGGVTDLKTTLAMTTSEMKDVFVKAGPVAPVYRPPG